MRADIPFVGGRSYLLIALLLAVVIAATWLWMSKIRAVRPLITGGPGRTALMVAFAGLGYAGSGFVVFAFGHYQGLPISYALVATIMGVAVLGIWLRLRVEDKSPSSRRNFVAGLVSACAMNFVFVVGLYFLTAGPFGGELFSFERYMSTPCVLGLTFLVLYVATQHWGQTRTVRGSAATLVVALALSTLALLFPLRAPLAFDGGWNTQAATESALLVQAAEKSPPIRTEGRDPGVFLVFAGPPIEDAGLHHRIYFNMIGSGFEVRNYYTETEIAAATNRAASTYQADAAKARRNFEDQLRSDTYDFVYVVETDSELSSQFHAIFPGGPAEHALYRVDRSGSEPVLTRAN